MADATRDCIFISHATPDDNPFVSWLGAKLSSLGYEVWADIFQLRGGKDWSRELEQALRTRSAKMLLVCTPTGLERQGVRNEIEIADRVSKQINDPEFIIPLRLQPFEPPFRIAHLQYVDFNRSWATGLTEITERLAELRVPRVESDVTIAGQRWLAEHARGSTHLVEKPEPLMSNWLKVRSIPAHVQFYDKPGGMPLETFQDRSAHRWPIVPLRGGVLAFGPPELKLTDAESAPAKPQRERATGDFMSEGWPDLGVRVDEARRAMADFVGQAFNAACQARGLKGMPNANGHLSWWGDIKTAPLSQVKFDWGYRRGSRQIVGLSKNIHWHLALRGQFRSWPVEHLRLKTRLVFTLNGIDPIEDKDQAHALRRKVAKSWRNAKWRDMLGAYLWWLTDGQVQLRLPVAVDRAFTFAVPPMQFAAPVKVSSGFDAEQKDAEESDEDAMYDEEEPDLDADAIEEGPAV